MSPRNLLLKKHLKTSTRLLSIIVLILVVMSSIPLPAYDLSSDSSAEAPETIDSDGDGLTDEEEIKNGTNPEMKDTDEDGISDYDELTIYGTCPWRESTDGDMYDDII